MCEGYRIYTRNILGLIKDRFNSYGIGDGFAKWVSDGHDDYVPHVTLVDVKNKGRVNMNIIREKFNALCAKYKDVEFGEVSVTSESSQALWGLTSDLLS